MSAWDRLSFLVDERLGDWLEEKIERYPLLAWSVAFAVVFGTIGIFLAAIYKFILIK